MAELKPVFLIEIPPEPRSEREYALSVLFGDWLGTPYALRVVEGLHETHVSLASDADGVRIVLPDVLLARDTEFLSPGSLPPAMLPTVGLPAWAGMDGRLAAALLDGYRRRTSSSAGAAIDLSSALTCWAASCSCSPATRSTSIRRRTMNTGGFRRAHPRWPRRVGCNGRSSTCTSTCSPRCSGTPGRGSSSHPRRARRSSSGTMSTIPRRRSAGAAGSEPGSSQAT